MQTKTTMRYYFILTRIAGIRSQITTSIGKDIEIVETMHTAGGNVK